MRKIVLLGMCMLILCGCENEQKEIDVANISQNKVISCEEKTALLSSDENAKLIDVRTIAEFNEGHLDSAINIEVDNIDKIKTYSLIHKDTPLIVYCRSGQRSSKAKMKLEELGYTKVYDLGAMSNCSK